MRVVNRMPFANGLLDAVPRDDRQCLLASLEPVMLSSGTVIHEHGAPIRHVYFPNDALVSLLMVDGHQTLKIGLVGREGMVGIALALGVNASQVRAVVQKRGAAMRMTSARFRKALRDSLTLQREVYRYIHALMAEARQAAFCNRYHGMDARLARLLLTTRDGERSDQFHLTHEYVAQMLGVRRVGVTKAAGDLQRKKLIDYSRGNIRILDGRRLEAAACTCYRIVKNLQVRRHRNNDAPAV